MSDDKTIIMPDSQNNMVPAWFAYGNNNGLNNGLFGGGFGNGFLGGILGGLIPGFFGGNWGGNWGGNGNAAAASLGAQATANANAEMIMNAINGTDADVRLLATTLNGDVDSIRLAINTVQGAIAQVASQTGLTGLQVINAIQSGNAELAQSLCRCCCDQRQLTVEQGYQNQIRTLQQTEALGGAIADLKATMIVQFCQSEKRDMQDKINTQAEIITQLRNQADNAAQSLQLNAGIGALNARITELAAKMPNTVPVTYPNLSVVNNTPYNGFNGWGYGLQGGSYWG